MYGYREICLCYMKNKRAYTTIGGHWHSALVSMRGSMRPRHSETQATAADWECRPTNSGGHFSFWETEYEFSWEASALSMWAQPLKSDSMGRIDSWASSFQHLPYIFVGQCCLLCEIPVGKTVVSNSFIRECHCFAVGKMREEKRIS